ncbi:MAG: molybdenum cofactor guanylyltransferase [Ignavibacteriaceae bacterium]
MYDNITGIILSGGKSTRMGENKSMMKIGNKTIIEHVKVQMESLFSKIILITNDPVEYEFLNLEKYKDIYFRMGPLAGIHSGLTHSSTDKNFIISCDIPLMTPEMIKYLVDYKTIKPVTIAKADGFIQQLCGVYHKSCLPSSENILSSNKNDEERNEEQKKRGCKVLGLIDIVGAEIIDAESLPFYKKDMFFNMNRRSDYESILKRMTVEI